MLSPYLMTFCAVNYRPFRKLSFLRSAAINRIAVVPVSAPLPLFLFPFFLRTCETNYTRGYDLMCKCKIYDSVISASDLCLFSGSTRQGDISPLRPLLFGKYPFGVWDCILPNSEIRPANMEASCFGRRTGGHRRYQSARRCLYRELPV